MRILVALFCLTAFPAYADCAKPEQREVEVVLPGQPALPAAQQLRMKVPVTLATGDCPVEDEPVADVLHGAPPPKRGLLRGEGEGNLLNPKPVQPQTP